MPQQKVPSVTPQVNASAVTSRDEAVELADLSTDTSVIEEPEPQAVPSTQTHKAVAASVPPPSSENNKPEPDQRWYLGIDVGSTGISAVLLDRHKSCLHPISWQQGQSSPPGRSPSESSDSASENQTLTRLPESSFRLPATVLIAPRGKGRGSSILPMWGVSQDAIALQQSMAQAEASEGTAPASPSLVLDRCKDRLNIAIPHYSPQTRRWEPEIRSGGRSLVQGRAYPLPLSWFYQALQTLLATLAPSSRVSLPVFPIDGMGGALSYRIWGLSRDESREAMQALAGVIIGYPASWSAAYRFNVREAVLGARLVSRADQVVMVNDAIATLLSRLPSADGTPIVLPEVFGTTALQAQTESYGTTLVINAGAATTELAIATLLPPPASSVSRRTAQAPVSAPRLNPNAMVFRSLAYAGHAIDQDIISQLLYPRIAEASASVFEVISVDNPASGRFSAGPRTRRVSWLQRVGLDPLNLPSAGEPDPSNRQALQQQLQRSPLGPILLHQARSLKLTLQTRKTARFTLPPAFAHALKTQQWELTQDELGNRVLLPYMQRLHREMNALLEQAGLTPSDVRHIVCTGGTASLRFMTIWLQKTFANATIAQDAYQGDRTPTLIHNIVPTCSRVAYGLASLPLHPHVVDWVARQLCDYDFLVDLGRILPDSPLTLRHILDLLERRGISSVKSQPYVMSLLAGRLPVGLVPQGTVVDALTPASKRYGPYQQLLAEPLFDPIDGQTYRLNRRQWILLQQYLSALTTGTRQMLFQPQVAMVAR